MKRVSKKVKNRRITIGLIISSFVILTFVVTLIQNVYNYTQLKKENELLNNQLEQSMNTKQQLQNDIEKLKDPDYISRYAKEKYNFSEENGEYVLRLIEDEEEEKEEEKTLKYSDYYVMVLILIFLILFIKRLQKKVE